MKKIFILSIAAAGSFMAASCKAELKDTTKVKKYEPLTLVASAEESTKTYLDGLNTVWYENDCISVFSRDVQEPANNRFFIKEYEAGSSTARFSGEVEEGTGHIAALYPYSESSVFDGAGIVTTLPAEQTAAADTFDNGASLLFGSGAKDGDIRFANICTVVSFVLPEGLDFVSSVRVSAANGSNIAGTVQIDADNGSIVSADSPTVTLKGVFTGGNRYYVTLAPGSYEGGLKFEMETSAGNRYYRANTSVMALAAGKIYSVGTLSLVVGSISPSAEIVHQIEGGILTGSKAVLSLNVPSEFAGAMSNVSYTAEIRNADGAVVRTLEGSGLADSVLDLAGGFHYLPAGEYTCTVSDFKYTANGVSRTSSEPYVFTAVSTAPADGSIAFTAVTSGYTSYNVYLNQGAAAANELDGLTVYGLSAVYTGGLSDEVRTQCEGICSICAALEGNAVTGEEAKASRASHVIDAQVTFDSVVHNVKGSTTVYVTSIPVSYSSRSSYDGWSINASNATNNKYSMYNTSKMTSCSYPVPASVDLAVTMNISPSSGTKGNMHCNGMTAAFTSSTKSLHFETSITNASTLEFTVENQGALPTLRYTRIDGIVLQYR